MMKPSLNVSESAAAKVRNTLFQLAMQNTDFRTNILEQANHFVIGEHILPGTHRKYRSVGTPPLWNDNPVNDAEFIWGLNRHAHWRTLLRGWVISGESRYAERVLAELEDWIEQCPVPDLDIRFFDCRGKAWRSLEVGIRFFETWTALWEYLPGTEFWTEKLERLLMKAAESHGRILEVIPPQMWPDANHNHYLMENLGLLTISCVFPELPHAQRWQKHALKELSRCVYNQITRDGVHIEGCPHYHNGCFAWFSRIIHLVRKYNLSFDDEYQRRIENMLTYSLSCLKPDHQNMAWGDSDCGTDAEIRALVSGALLSGRSDVLSKLGNYFPAGALRQSCLEFCEYGDANMLTVKSAISPHILSGATFPSVQQAILRSHDQDQHCLGIICRTPIYNAHAHIDCGSFDFSNKHGTFLTDPGRYCYREDHDRQDFKSAKFHNMLLINDQEPFDYISSWQFGPQQRGGMGNLCRFGDWQAIAVWHDNFKPVCYVRTFFLRNDGLLLIWDKLSRLKAEDTIQLYFHFDAPLVEWAENRASTSNGHMSGQLLVSECPAEAMFLPGKVSDRLDSCRPSQRLRLQYSGIQYDFSLLTAIYTGEVSHGCPDLKNAVIEQHGEVTKLCVEKEGMATALAVQDFEGLMNFPTQMS